MAMVSLIENSLGQNIWIWHGYPLIKKTDFEKFQNEYDILRYYFTSSIKLMVISSELLSNGFIPAFNICSKCSFEMPSNDDAGIVGVLGIPRSASRRP